MNDKSILRMTQAGVVGALVFVATYFIKVPMILGYIHLGDGLILAGAALLGPIVWLPAAIGSSLADFMGGYSLFILPTFLIKGAVGYLAGRLLQKGHEAPRVLLSFIFCELVMVLGYFITEIFLYSFAGAVASIAGNLVQGLSGVVIGLILMPAMATLGRKPAFHS
ncbi:Substrate-specific component PdxU2 of predicted pyridoxin-related ECF transporter [Clostridiaceae bacterium JG1575]|nr:Substrate-specific component PdxU2 of predicted pyridoxin-related ECF transporter [Clostridiaceae bacterium JG1575]